MNAPPEGYFPKYGIFENDDDEDKKSGKSKSDQKGTLSQTDSLLSTLIKNIPDKNLQNGLKEYLKIVNPKAYQDDESVGGSNNGIVQYFQSRFAENQCFMKAAIDFYRDVATTLKKQNKCEPEVPRESSTDKEAKGSIPPSGFCFGPLCPKVKKTKQDSVYGCMKNRPSIDDRVGQGSKSYLDEGWLMRLALKHAKGNPEAAFELIGMCGHDDVSQGSFKYYDSSEAAKAKNIEQVEQLKAQKKAMDEELKKAFKNFDSDQKAVYALSKKAQFASTQIEELTKAEGRRERVTCPPKEADFYLPGSLSSNADISPTLKEKIKTVQGDGKNDTSFIPAKHYHVYGSALLGCKMAQNGMTPDQASTVQKQAARLYRGIRMCDSSKSQLQIREQLKQTLQVKNFEDSKEVETKVLQVWDQKNKGDFKCEGMGGGIFGMMGTMMKNVMKDVQKEKPEGNSSLADQKSMEKCTMLMSFGIAELETSERSIALKKINTALGRYDAAKLYDSWYVGGGSFAGIKFPCTDHRNKGPSDLMKPNEGFMGKLFKPSGWTEDRYEVATKKLATWDVDFEWTIAQHEAGSKYGAKLCSDTKNKKNPFEEQACYEKQEKGIERMG